VKNLSLFDLADQRIVDVWLAFYDDPTSPRQCWDRWLQPGFKHVEVWKHNGLFWLRVNPYVEHADVTADYGPPWVSLAAFSPTVIHVRRAVPANKPYDLCAFGPQTCVELAKAFIGLRNFFVRTPYQLYKKLKDAK
jgi:hypothetical protein